MNIQIMSDLHLEHDNRFIFKKAENADILILAGDIGSILFSLILFVSALLRLLLS